MHFPTVRYSASTRSLAGAGTLGSTVTLPPGHRLGPYEIVGPIGEGGMGEVYRALDTRLGRAVALKILPDVLAKDEEYLRRFRQEARTASALNHPNIVTIHDVGEAKGLHYTAMELVEGQTLSELFLAGPVDIDLLIQIAAQVADGMAKAHALGIVHRDLKPANIMFTPDGYAKILDFGLAKVFANDRLASATHGGTLPAETQAGIVVGTLGYMSPEQAEGSAIDFRSDQFCLGAVLYEALSGRRAFEGASAIRTIIAIISDDPPSLVTLAPQAPARLCDVVERCMAKRPEDRYASSEDLATDLAALRERTARPLGSRVAKLPTARERRRHRHLLSGAIALLVVFGLWLVWPPEEQPPQGYVFGKARSLETSDDRLGAPDLSPDGKMVAFVATRDGQTDLYVRRVVAPNALQLTDDPARDFNPDFSPDGETIAYTRAYEGVSSICLIRSLGGQVTTAVEGASQPTWSPDGRRLAFIQYTEGEGISLATARSDGSDRQVVLRGDANYPFLSSPAWSPNDAVIAVVRGRGGAAQEVWLVPSSGGKARPLTSNDEGYSGDPVFSADGRGVIYSSTRNGARNLWFTALDGSESVQITKGSGPDNGPSVAQDGTLVYHTARWRQVLRVHDLKTKKSHELLRHAAFLWAPVFSPDGSHVAYSRAEVEGAVHIWVIPTAGGTSRQLTFGDVPEVHPRFSHDGTEILFHTWSPAHRDRCYRIPFAGGPRRPATPDHEANEGYGQMSPDGTSITFARQEEGAEYTYIAGADGGKVRRLTASPATVASWSPKGDWIAFARDRGYAGGIFVIRPDGSAVRRVSTRGGWPTWWPDGKRIGYLVVGPGGDQQIEMVSIDGGGPTILDGMIFSGVNHPFDVSQDGRMLTTSDSVHLLSEIWLLQPER